MSVPTLKEFLTEEMRGNAQRFREDLEAMPEEMFGTSPGGCARTPLDLTYEVAYVNHRVATRLKGGDPGPWSPIPWTKAPEGFDSKEGAIAHFQASCDELFAAWEAFPEEHLKRPIQTAMGQTDAIDIVALASRHMHYHDAQFNYIQTLANDAEMHWGFD